jgi:hypothetical protein
VSGAPFTGAAVFQRRGDIVSRDVAGERLLVPIRGDLAAGQRVFTLNPVAACVWDGLDGAKNLGEILQGVVERFDVSREEAEADIGELMNALQEQRLLERVG